MRIVFAAKNYQTGLNINFKVYDSNQTLIFDDLGTEWGTTGNYYIDISLTPTEFYLIIAEETAGNWKASRYVIGGVDIGDYITVNQYYKEDNLVTSLSSNTWQTKLEFSKANDNIIEGNYILHWQIEAYNDTKDGFYMIQLIDNENTQYAHYKNVETINVSESYKTISGFSRVTFDDIKTNYYLQVTWENRGIAYFRRARLSLNAI